MDKHTFSPQCHGCSYFYAETQQQDNPYAAPQTRELVLPLAHERAELRTTSSDEVLPRSTQRWLNAALAIYVFAFVVPLPNPNDHWTPFAGAYFFVSGAVMCWHPMLFGWWANLFFLLSRRNLRRGRSQRGCVYAGIGGLAAASLLVLVALDHGPNGFFFHLFISPPYFCWLAAMILQWIAAVDMRQYNRNRVG